MAEKQSDVSKRIRNPNKDFDALVWRPKNKFLRRFMARYIDYVTVLAYFWVALVIGGVIFTWTVPSIMWTSAKDMPLLTPVKNDISSPVAGVLTFVVDKGKKVVVGDTLAVVKAADGNPNPIISGFSGWAYPKSVKDVFQKIAVNDSVKDREVILQVIDFKSFSADCEFSKFADSIDIGDSASVVPVGHSESKKNPPFSLILAWKQGRKNITSKVGYMVETEFLKELNAALEDDSLMIKKHGLYVVDEIKEGKLNVSVKAHSKDAERGDLIASATPIMGVLQEGDAVIELDLRKVSSEGVKTAIDKYSQALVNKTITTEKGSFQVDSLIRRTMEIKVAIKQPLTVKNSYKSIPKSLRKNAIDAPDKKIKGKVGITNLPEKVSEAARLLYEAEPKSQYLNAQIKLNAYKTTWGKRLLKTN